MTYARQRHWKYCFSWFSPDKSRERRNVKTYFFGELRLIPNSLKTEFTSRVNSLSRKLKNKSGDDKLDIFNVINYTNQTKHLLQRNQRNLVSPKYGDLVIAFSGKRFVFIFCAFSTLPSNFQHRQPPVGCSTISTSKIIIYI